MSPLGRLVGGALAAALLAGPEPARAQQTPAQNDPAASASGAGDRYLEAYRQATPLVGWPLKTLQHQIPELRHLQPSDDQSHLPVILARVAENVRRFVSNSLNTTAIETIDESSTFGSTLARRGTVTVTQRFHYLTIVRPASSESAAELEEYRTSLNAGGRRYDNPATGFFATKGFASMPLTFSVQNQPLSVFRYLGTQVVAKRRYDVVAFSNRAEAGASRGAFQDGAISIPLLIQGVAWIEPDSYQILRMHTDMLAPQPSVGLEDITTRAEFQAVRFRSSAAALWLPKEVKVTVYLRKQVYSNRHRYKNYELFRVDTRQDEGSPPAAGGQPPPKAGGP